MITSIIGTKLVSAPNPNPGNPLLPLDVLITNTNPITVAVDGTVEITNTNPINVNIDGETVKIDDSTPLQVNVKDGVKVTNTNAEAIPVDVSGWLHTAQEGHQTWTEFQEEGNYQAIFIDTEGYREITIVFDSSKDNVDFGVAWELDGQFRYSEGWTYGSEKPATFTTPLGETPRYFFKTYQIQGELMEISWYAGYQVLASGDGVSIAYYMTT